MKNNEDDAYQLRFKFGFQFDPEFSVITVADSIE